MTEDPSTVSPALDAETRRAVRTFVRRLDGRYPVRDVILYGSRARQSHAVDSDADLAVVMAGRPGNRVAIGRDMAGTAFDVLLETGILVDALPLWDEEFGQPDGLANAALVRAIRRDGLHLPTVA